MKIFILLSAANRQKVEASFKQQKCVGIDFEYSSDFDEVVSVINARGFFMDKLVIISSMFNNAPEEDIQYVITCLQRICEVLPQDKEIYILDAKQHFKNAYTTLLSFYPQVIYQDQQVKVENLFDLITGDIKVAETPNINESVKKKGFFNRVFGKRNSQVQEAPTEPIEPVAPVEPESEELDVPLFEETTDQVNNDALSEDNADVVDVGDIFNSTAQVQTPVETYDDTPLFEEPPQQPAPVTKHVSKPIEQPPVLKVEQETEPKKNKSVKSDYVKFFQKRTKILLFTGERRSGISTVVSNCAQQAQNDGLKVLVVDLDYERRGQAYNFPFMHDENDVKMTHSLYNANKNPSQLEEYAIQLEDGLFFLGTSLAVTETNIMHEHITDASLQRLLTLATSMFDIIFIDCPYEQLREYSCLIMLANTIIHSLNSDQRSIVNTLNAITTDDFNDVTSYNTYMAKVMLLLNNYVPHYWNGKELNERMIPVFINELLGDNSFQSVTILGRIPYYKDYDKHMEDGNLLVSNKHYVKDFIEILNEIATRG